MGVSVISDTQDTHFVEPCFTELLIGDVTDLDESVVAEAAVNELVLCHAPIAVRVEGAEDLPASLGQGSSAKISRFYVSISSVQPPWL